MSFYHPPTVEDIENLADSMLSQELALNPPVIAQISLPVCLKVSKLFVGNCCLPAGPGGCGPVPTLQLQTLVLWSGAAGLAMLVAGEEF
jgi:hypothetical protein